MDNKKISEVFLEISEAIESGKFGKKVKIGLTTLGSEHGVENMKKAIELAKSDLFEVVVIGERVDDEHETYEVDNDEDMYKKMEELLDSGEIQACVTLHYNFPIGVSTVGRVYTPGHGKEMFLATTTGTSDTERTKAMVRNAVAGIIAAKSCGIAKPTVGILNIDGARQVEKALKHFKDNGFDIEFAESQRADGGIVMRGNDLLMGSCDVMVTDSLTGNLLMKMFGSFTSGGNYETTGFGYGPGIGEGYERNIFIVSRASGAPVVANAFSTCLAPSMFKIPTVGFAIPQDLAAITPATAFLTIAFVLSVSLVPVVVAKNISLPVPGVITLPTVETPIGKL